MTEPSTPITPSPSLNRRDVLKALAASGGALAAAAFLPGKWVKPLMEVGVLPAHAQGSICVEIAYVGEGDCADYPALNCGQFDHVVEFSYAPTKFTPSSVTVDVCNVRIPSSMVRGQPGQIFVFMNVSDLQCEGPRILTVYMREGCYGILVTTPGGAHKPGTYYR